MGWIHKYLSVDDFKKIEDTIARVENETSGEIVPVIVRRSSAVGHIPLTLTLLFTLLVVIAEFPFSDWLWVRPWVYLWPFLIVAFYMLSQLLMRSQWIQKAFVSERDELDQVHQRAEVEFYRNKVNRTTDGTGVLIFVSVMEKKAVILADEGISKKLPEDTWNDVLNQLRKDLKEGDWAKGFTEAIENCAKHLKTHFPITSAVRNELKNHLVVKD